MEQFNIVLAIVLHNCLGSISDERDENGSQMFECFCLPSYLSLGVGGSCVSLQEVCANVSHLFLCAMSGGVIFLLLHLVLNLVDTVGTGPISSRRLYSQCLEKKGDWLTGVE